MTESNYYFPDTAKEIAKASGLDDIAKKITDDQYGENIFNPFDDSDINLGDFGWNIEMFKRSALFGQLDEEGAYRFQKALELEQNRAEWSLVSSQLEQRDTLFPVQKEIGRAVCYSSDILTLSGVASVTYELAEPDIVNGIFARHAEFGFDTPHDFMVFADALLANKARENTTFYVGHGPSMVAVRQDEVRKTIVAGDMNGDFMLKQELGSNEGAISPIGTRTLFSPKLTSIVRGYHSVEPSLAAAVSAFVLHKSPDQTSAFVGLQGVLHGSKKSGSNVGADFYGDYGDMNGYFNARPEILYCIARMSHSTLLSSLFVSPGNRELALTVEEQGDEVSIYNQQGEAKSSQIKFNFTEALQLLEVFCGIGAASLRTSEAQILEVVEAARDLVVESTSTKTNITELAAI